MNDLKLIFESLRPSTLASIISDLKEDQLEEIEENKKLQDYKNNFCQLALIELENNVGKAEASKLIDEAF